MPLARDERAHDELLRHADAEAAGDQLVPDEALGAVELAPGSTMRRALCVLRLLRERQQALLHPLVERARRVVDSSPAAAAATSSRRDRRPRRRTPRIATRGCSRSSIAHCGETAHGNEPLRPTAARGSTRPTPRRPDRRSRSTSTIASTFSFVRVVSSIAVKSRAKRFTPTISSPATVDRIGVLFALPVRGDRSTRRCRAPSASARPARAYPCVTHTRSAPVASTAASSDGQST